MSSFAPSTSQQQTSPPQQPKPRPQSSSSSSPPPSQQQQLESQAIPQTTVTKQQSTFEDQQQQQQQQHSAQQTTLAKRKDNANNLDETIIEETINIENLNINPVSVNDYTINSTIDEKQQQQLASKQKNSNLLIKCPTSDNKLINLTINTKLKCDISEPLSITNRQINDDSPPTTSTSETNSPQNVTQSSSELMPTRKRTNNELQKNASLIDMVARFKNDYAYDRLSLNSTSLGTSFTNLYQLNNNLSVTKVPNFKRHSTQFIAPTTSTEFDRNNNSRLRESNIKTSDHGTVSAPIDCSIQNKDCGQRFLSKNQQSRSNSVENNEKKVTNRQQYIEQYYSSKIVLPHDTSSSSLSMDTPINILSECEAITKRLLSSPIRKCEISSNQNSFDPQLFDVEQSAARISSNEESCSSITKEEQVNSKSGDTLLEYQVQPSYVAQRANTMNSPKPGSESKVSKTQSRSQSVSANEAWTREQGPSHEHSANLHRCSSSARSSNQSHSKFIAIIPLFGCDMNSLAMCVKSGFILPPVIDSAISYILANGVSSIGIFRKSGVKSRILFLKKKIEDNQDLIFNDMVQNNEFSIYDIADLVKMWFRELKPVPLVTNELIELISSAIQKSCNPYQDSFSRSTGCEKIKEKQCGLDNEFLKLRIESITSPMHRALLIKALSFLEQISMKCHMNQMTSQNLAICLTPSLCATESDQGAMLRAQKVLEFCIDNHKNLFS